MNRIVVQKGVSGSPIVLGFQRKSAEGGYEGDASTYTDSDPLVCLVWPGGDLPPSAELPVNWVDPAAGTVQVQFPSSAWNGLDPGVYQAVVRLGTNPPLNHAFFEVELVAGPAGGIARPVYISAEEINEEFPGLETRLGQLDADQSGFAVLRADARNWVDLAVLSHYRASCGTSPYQFDIPWATSQPETNEFLADLLADGALMQWTPNGRRLRKAQVYWVLGKVFRRAANNTVNAPNLLDLAEYYETKASDTLMTSVAEIDSDGDEIVNFSISLRSTVTRRR